jgi:multidrug efflux pump
VKHFNLSEWALAHRGLVLYFMIALAVMGVFSYDRLGQSEDPPFTFKVMVVRTLWPGATAREVADQVTDRIEKKLQEAPYVDVLRSYSKPGESLVFFLAKDSTPPSEVPNIWYQVRKKIGDITQTLPAGVQGPFFNDEFGDTFGNIYALTGDGFDYAQLKKYADHVRSELLRVPGVAKVEFFGEQEEKVFIEISNSKLANLGIDPQTIFTTLQKENALAPSGVFETASDRVFLRVSGDFGSLDEIRNISLRANGRLIRLGDIAKVTRGYIDPPASKMRFRGQEAFGIGVSMAKGGDILDLGDHLEVATARLQSELPVGVELHQVSNQPDSVKRSIREFLRTLAEAVRLYCLSRMMS